MAVVCRERLASGRSFSGVRGGEWCSRCNAVHPQERCSHRSGCTARRTMHPDRRNRCIRGWSRWFCLFQGCDCCGFAVSFGHGRSIGSGWGFVRRFLRYSQYRSHSRQTGIMGRFVGFHFLSNGCPGRCGELWCMLRGQGGRRRPRRPSWWGGLLSEFLCRVGVDAGTGSMHVLAGS